MEYIWFMAKGRKSVPDRIVAELQHKSDMKCCLCKGGGLGGQIHHLDGNPENNQFDNLVWLCPNHHDKAESKSTISKKLNPLTIKMYREDLYRLVEKERIVREAELDEKIAQLQGESSFVSDALTAQILLKITEAKELFYDGNWEEREIILKGLYKYSDFTNARITNDLFDFLWSAAHLTRSGMPSKVAFQVESLVTAYYNYGTEESARNELGKKAIHIGFDMMYDALIKIHDLQVAVEAWSIIKYMQRMVHYFKVQELIELIDSEYSGMQGTLIRPERTDLGPAQELVEIFIKDLENVGDLHYPWIPPELEARFPRKSDFM